MSKSSNSWEFVKIHKSTIHALAITTVIITFSNNNCLVIIAEQLLYEAVNIDFFSRSYHYDDHEIFSYAMKFSEMSEWTTLI